MAQVAAFASFALAALFWLRGGHIVLDNLAAFLWPSLWGSLAVAVVCSFLGRRWIFALAIAAFASNLWLISPWLFESAFSGSRKESGSYPYTLKVGVANVRAENRDFARVVKWVQDFRPDILVLIEVDARWVKGIAAIDAELSQSLKQPADDSFGIAVYSRHPLLARNVENFSDEGIRSLHVLVDAPGGLVRVLATHALPPLDKTWFLDRNRHLERMGAWSRGLTGDLILAGDLNVVPWSTHYPAVESGGLRNIRPQAGLLPTWPAFFPEWMRAPIDHLLYRGGLVLKTARLGPDLGSDHMPLEAEFVR